MTARHQLFSGSKNFLPKTDGCVYTQLSHVLSDQRFNSLIAIHRVTALAVRANVVID